jgi:hypothetical protein
MACIRIIEHRKSCKKFSLTLRTCATIGRMKGNEAKIGRMRDIDTPYRMVYPLAHSRPLIDCLEIVLTMGSPSPRPLPQLGGEGKGEGVLVAEGFQDVSVMSESPFAPKNSENLLFLEEKITPWRA